MLKSTLNICTKVLSKIPSLGLPKKAKEKTEIFYASVPLWTVGNVLIACVGVYLRVLGVDKDTGGKCNKAEKRRNSAGTNCHLFNIYYTATE